MAQAKLEKTSQICRLIDRMAPYKGSSTGLHSFIAHVDEILSTSEPKESVHVGILVRTIRDRIQDKANEALELYNTGNSWEEIKRNLITHFADRRDESVLIQDLHNLYQGNDNVEIYFAKVLDIVNSLKNWAKLNEPVSAPIKIEWYDRMGLNIFCSKLREPLGSHVRSRQPSDLPSARTICMKEQNLGLLKHNNFNRTPIKPLIPPRVFPSHTRPIQFNNPQYNYPKPVYNYAKPTHNQGPNIYYNHRPFAPQQNSFGKPNFPPRPQIMNKPEPMDTSSNPNKFKQFTHGQQWKRPSSQQGNNFSQKQPRLFNIEQIPNEHYDPYNPYDQYDYTQESYEPYEIYEQPNDQPIQEEQPIIEIEDEDFPIASSEIQDT